MPLSGKVRIEIFIPDLPDPIYGSILEELGNELTFTYGGCTVVSASGKFRSSDGFVLPDKIYLLFSDTPFLWERDRLVIEYHAQRIRSAVTKTLAQEESVLVAIHPVYHAE